jgi:hypothetical protein
MGLMGFEFPKGRLRRGARVPCFVLLISGGLISDFKKSSVSPYRLIELKIGLTRC